MARTLNEQDYSQKRSEILDAAQKLIYTQGYEKMTIQGILAELQISNGAFYHYFDSKQAVLEALIERMQEAAEQPLHPIAADPKLSAVEKLQGYFATLDQSRSVLKAFLAGLARVWYTDDNAIVRQKVDEAIVVRRAPMLNAIVRQGIEEGTFTTLYPEQAGEIILALASGLGNTIGRLMLAYRPEHPQDAEVIAATYAAYANAIERALGARARFLACPNADMVREWLA